MRWLRLIGLLLVLALVLSTARQSVAAPSTCILTGTLYNLNGSAAASQRVYFSYDQAQNYSGTVLPAGGFSVTTNSSGVLPTVTAIQGAFMSVKVGAGPVTKIQIPLQTTADISTLILANTDPPSIVASITSANGNCSVTNPSTGAIGTATLNCSGGSGSGTVINSSSGTLAAYPSTGTAVQGITLGSPYANSGSSFTWNPTAALPMNSQQITGMAGATVTGGATAFGQTGARFNDMEGTSVNGTLNPMAPKVLVAGTTNTYLTAGAACDGATDDTTALQNTILASCGMSTISSSPTSAPHPAVLIPLTANSCLHSQPLRVPCKNFAIFGENAGQYAQAALSQSYDGATINISSYQLANLTFASNVGMTGNSLVVANGNVPYISLSDYLDTPKLNTNGLANIDVQGVDERSSFNSGTGTEFYDSAPNTPGASNQYYVNVSVNPFTSPPYKVQAFIQTATSGQVTITGPVLSTSTPYYWHVSKSGNTCNFYVNGTNYGPTTCTGNIVQSPFEQGNIPAQGSASFWPYAGNLDESGAGGNAFIWVSNVARTDSGFPASKPIVDGNTLLLCNWATENTPDGTQECYNGTKTGSSIPVYFNVNLYSGQSASQLNGGRLYNLNLNKPATSGSYTNAASDGVYTAWGSNQEFDHLSNPNCNAYGISLLTYSSKVHDNSFGNNTDYCRAAAVTTAQDNTFERNQYWGWVGLAAYNETNVVSVADQPSQGTVQLFPYFFQQVQFALIGPNTDNEAGDSVMLAGLVYQIGNTGGFTNEIINPQQVQSSNNAPMIIQNSGESIHILGGSYSGSSPSEAIDIVGTPPSLPDLAEGFNIGSAIAMSNLPNSVINIGASAAKSVSGTNGTAVLTQASAGPGGITDVVLTAYNETGGAQTITYPQAFQVVPNIIQSGCSEAGSYPATSTSTRLTLPANASMTQESCTIRIEGS